MKLSKIGLGGSCHWCTEAIFQSIKGVEKVDQGWIASKEDPIFSEAVIVHFCSEVIDPGTLIEIHLHSHSSTANHSMRKKYRSAVYTFSQDQHTEVKRLLDEFQKDFDQKLVTQVHTFLKFQLNKETYLNYYLNNPERPFCQNVIHPKLIALRKKFGKYM